MNFIKTDVNFVSNCNGSTYEKKSSLIIPSTKASVEMVNLYNSKQNKSDSMGKADRNNIRDYKRVYIPDNNGNNRVPYFSQGKNNLTGSIPSWTNEEFGDKTIEKSGCSITSFSMVLSYLLGNVDKPNTYIYPDDVVQKIINETGSRYTYHYKNVGPDEGQIFPVLCDMYDLNYEVWTSRFSETVDGVVPNKINKDEIISEIRKGSPMICHASKGKFTTGGHFIVVTGITPDGKLVVNDPNNASYSYEKFTFEELQSYGVDSFWKISE